MADMDLTDADFLQSVEEALLRAGVQSIEIKTKSQNLKLVLQPGKRAGVDLSSTLQACKTAFVEAPIAGHFAALDAVVEEGAVVAPDTCLGFITIGPVLVPVTAGMHGKVLRQMGALEHFPEKWKLGFGKIRRENKDLEHSTYLDFRHDALDGLVGYGTPLFELEVLA